MVEVVFKLLGGIGLFLLAMGLLTDGLKSFAGQALSRALVRFTGTPIKAFSSGVLVTLLVQSSTATTVTLIGFVSAGLIAFPQAVGVVMGASLGTTGTGWLVAALGLKVSLGFYALPLVGIGAFGRLLGRGRWNALGTAVAGFGMIFVGIDLLQEGMAGVSGMFDLNALPTTGLGAHALVLLLGIVMTLIMQSSTAAVATTLTGLSAGAINFDQAAVLVIGASIGTTATGVLAAMGATVPAKRTALAHVVFNLVTGLLALLILPAFLWVIGMLQRHVGLGSGPVSLAAFHSLFIATGVLLFLPFAHRFAAFIERLLPDRGLALTQHLDSSVLHVPAVALEATHRALADTACAVFAGLQAVLNGEHTGAQQASRQTIRQALEQTQNFFARIPANAESESLMPARLAQMHAIEHLQRLYSRLRVPRGLSRMLVDDSFQLALAEGRQALRLAELGLQGTAPVNWLESLQHSANVLTNLRQEIRPAFLALGAGGQQESQDILQATDFIRWLERSAHHAWRAAYYLSNTVAEAAAEGELDALED